MLAHAPAFAPEQFRGWLLLLAQNQWDNALRDWGDPSDLVHLTMLEAHQMQKDFQGNTPQMFAAWLKQIFLNNLVDVSRRVHRKKRDPNLKRSLEAALDESSSRLGFSLALNDPSPSSVVARREQLNLLADAIAKLPPAQARAVTLHHLKGLSLKATAQQMGRTEPSVAGLLRRGLEQLRGLMGVVNDERRSG
jgi:RNA polymerase sigma-70 factor (ECF subfamily)